ncbi:hypothetical protein LCGC14_1036340 [marine sediment metagenome]|uniref:Uncharacterized protein n=1 Tax=marine sediment metagenome TaxID=412755 RepID=A0A0F9QZ63_9ZZZZ
MDPFEKMSLVGLRRYQAIVKAQLPIAFSHALEETTPWAEKALERLQKRENLVTEAIIKLEFGDDPDLGSQVSRSAAEE